ncbi:unnamed protein product [Paramecium octaurelia]|uniref:Uncharacterized protein n=1 Tax=Paramecium octaurelia TaxID=43137 RepID=A0A8S1YNB9_PAROT|nr:unnamed protein product [Paramecium octaurelia]
MKTQNCVKTGICKMIQFRFHKYVQWDANFKKKILDLEKGNRKKLHKIIQHTTKIRRDKEGVILNIMKGSEENQQVNNNKEIIHQCIENEKSFCHYN